MAEQGTSARNPVHCAHLGQQDYLRVFEAMRRYTENRDANSVDFLLWVEHDPVFTQGQAGKAEHVLAPGAIPVIQADRGGQVTYHGPGQLVGYLLFDLKRLSLGIKALVRGIENAMLKTLLAYGVIAQLRDGAPGVYVGKDKVGALGLRVKRGCSYHGLSLNVAMDLEPYQRINPCGLLETGAVDLATLCAAAGASGPDISAVQERLQAELCEVFQLQAVAFPDWFQLDR